MIFFPHEIAEKRLSKAKIKKLINDDLTLNLEAIRSVSNENELIDKNITNFDKFLNSQLFINNDYYVN